MLKPFGTYSPKCDHSGHQDQQEWAFYTQRLLDYKVTSMIHIGVLYGGSEYNIAEIYHKKGIQCRIVAIDINPTPRLINTCNKIQATYPNVDLELWTCDTRELKGITEEFDAAFIDGDHSYKSVVNDFKLVRPITRKMIGFHDISFDVNGGQGVPRFFNEIRHNYRFEEVSYRAEGVYGIGILYMP